MAELDRSNVVFVEPGFIEILVSTLECKCSINASPWQYGFPGFSCVTDQTASIYWEQFRRAFSELQGGDDIKGRLQVITSFKNLMTRLELFPEQSAREKSLVAEGVGFDSMEALQAEPQA